MSADVAGGPVRLRVRDRLPVGGDGIDRRRLRRDEWTLSLRVPGWCREARLSVAGEPVAVSPDADGYVRVRRAWRPGTQVLLTLPMPPRVLAAHPRVDAVRGCVAWARGPIVYCLEQHDQPAGVALEDIRVASQSRPARGRRRRRPGRPRGPRRAGVRRACRRPGALCRRNAGGTERRGDRGHRDPLLPLGQSRPGPDARLDPRVMTRWRPSVPLERLLVARNPGGEDMPKSIVTRARARLVIACLVVAGALFALAACGGSSSDKSSTASGGGSSGSVDDGSKITMWTRAATSAYSQLLVDAYNKTHKNQVKLTVIPTDSYQPKIAAAAGGHSLPDVLSADVVFAPNYASKGLLADLTEPRERPAVQGCARPGAHQGVDLSGQDLRGTARHRPLGDVLQQGPVQEGRPGPREAADDGQGDGRRGAQDQRARRRRPRLLLRRQLRRLPALHDVADDLGLGRHGAQRRRHAVHRQQPSRRPRSTGSTSRCPRTGSSTRSPRTSRARRGPRRSPAARSGSSPRARRSLGTIKENKNLQVGVAPIPGLDGGESSFVGGDVLGIAATSKHTSAAWNFIAWTLSDEAQVECRRQGRLRPVAQRPGQQPVRAEGPAAGDLQQARRQGADAGHGELRADLQRPATGRGWSRCARRSTAATRSPSSTSTTARSTRRCRAAADPAREMPMTVSTERRRGRAARAGARRARAGAGRTLKAQRSRAGRAFAAPAAVIVAVFFVVPLGLSRVDVAAATGRCSAASTPSTRRRTTQAIDDPLFTQAVVFTLKYTAITTVVLSVVAFALALLVQESPAPARALPHRVLPARGDRAGGQQPALLRALQRDPRAAERHPARDPACRARSTGSARPTTRCSRRWR